MTPDDDPTIADATLLYRRVHPTYIVHDDDGDCERVSSGAFKERSKEMSVHLGDVLEASGREPAEIVEDLPHFLISLTAERVRAYCQVVVRSPTPSDDSHGDVIGSKSKTTRKGFAEAARWVVAPDNACADPA
jgi:hypothetical protein